MSMNVMWAYKLYSVSKITKIIVTEFEEVVTNKETSASAGLQDANPTIRP